MNTISFNIPGEPVAMGRHRTTKTGHTYMPKKTVNAKSHIAYCVSREIDMEPIKSAVSLNVTFYMPAPQSVIRSAKKQNRDIEKIPVMTKPDIDNMVKTVGDALNGILWADDKQIINITAKKFYSERPRTQLTINWSDHQ